MSMRLPLRHPDAVAEVQRRKRKRQQGLHYAHPVGGMLPRKPDCPVKSINLLGTMAAV
jgi:hypothetical protein